MYCFLRKVELCESLTRLHEKHIHNTWNGTADDMKWCSSKNSLYFYKNYNRSIGAVPGRGNIQRERERERERGTGKVPVELWSVTLLRNGADISKRRRAAPTDFTHFDTRMKRRNVENYESLFRREWHRHDNFSLSLRDLRIGTSNLTKIDRSIGRRGVEFNRDRSISFRESRSFDER